MKYFKILLKFTFFVNCILAQAAIGEWGAFTSPLNVKDVKYKNIIYAATEGGLLIIDDYEHKVLTTIDGLEAVDISTIEMDHESNLWLGGSYPYGFIQIFDPSSINSVDIFDFGLTNILDIIILDSLAFALFDEGQDFGILKFEFDQKWEYRDSFKNFPNDVEYIRNFVAKSSEIHIGTNKGIFIGYIDDNLKDPNSWSSLNDDINHEITSMSLVGKNLLYSSRNHIYEYDYNLQILDTFDLFNEYSNIDLFQLRNDSLWIINEGDLFFKKSNNEEIMIYSDSYLSALSIHQNEILLGTSFGLTFVNMGSNLSRRLLPNAPAQNNFSALTVLKDGRLVGGNANGISILDNNGWRNILEVKKINSNIINEDYDYSAFIADTIPYDFGGFISDIEEGPDGLIYIAIRGSYPQSANPNRSSGGVISIDIDNPNNVTTIDTSILSYHSTSSNSNPYMVVLDIEFDSKGNLWILNPYCINGNNPIHVRSPDGIWRHYGSSETSTKISQSPISIEFDIWDRVWYSAFQAEEANLGIYPNGGIFMLQYVGHPYEPMDISWSQILNSGTVWSLSMGSENRIYYLTPNGLNYYDISENKAPVVSQNNYPFFPNVSFGQGSELKTDSHFNIWAHSPTQGVHILLNNTTYWPTINGLRTSNSPLLSDEITDIAFDAHKNLAYISTSKGINSLRIPFGIEKENFSKITVFPSPFFIPSDNILRVDGLPYDSHIIVMTLDGKVIKRIENRGLSIDGDQLSWDGRDDKGFYVSSGVYLLALYGPNGSNSMEKITVINR